MFASLFVSFYLFNEMRFFLSTAASVQTLVPDSGKTKSSFFYLIAQLQHDSWNSLQSHAALSVSMSCFSVYPSPSPAHPPHCSGSDLSPPSNHRPFQRRGAITGLQRLKKKNQKDEGKMSGVRTKSGKRWRSDARRV